MIRLTQLMMKQGERLLSSKNYALLCAVLLALVSHTTWLSMAVIALITLRKGWQEGTRLLLPVATAHFALALASYSVGGAIADTLFAFLPGYLAAIALYATTSWRIVAGVLFLQVLVIVVALQLFLPDFISAQYLYIQAIIRAADPSNALLNMLSDASSLQQLVLANYLVGIQAVMVVFSALSSVLLARWVQSQLYYAGGFRQEVLTFRENQKGLLMLAFMLIAALHYNNVVAINLLPTFLFFSVLAGLSLCANALLVRKKVRGVFFILVIPLVLLPFVTIPFYIILGSLDSIFNFRLYLPSDAGKTT